MRVPRRALPVALAVTLAAATAAVAAHVEDSYTVRVAPGVSSSTRR
ncbi:MAG TPA: hypothetical protein VNA20_08565 [Frankiaceae bacterium]|nr:hypothetical protein [Frankiaceae bacterium]